MEGYQRPLSDRYKKIASYMESHPSNFIPGTIIVASHRTDDFFQIEFVPLDNVPSSEHGLCKITFDYIPPEDLKVGLNEIIAEMESRLTPKELEDSQIDPTENGTGGDGGTGGMGSDSGEDEPDEIPGGTNGQTGSRMAQFLKTLRGIYENWDAVIESKSEDDPERIEWEDWILENHKIGYIMDGQHRVWGADNVNPANCSHIDDEQEPQLSITFIPNMSKAEQVFHFAMMNITPEKVKQGYRPVAPIRQRRPRHRPGTRERHRSLLRRRA